MRKVKIEMAVFTDKGAAKENQDRILMANQVYEKGGGQVSIGLPTMLAVCDGVGSCACGGAAAEFVLRKLAQMDAEEIVTTEQMQAVLDNINKNLVQEKNSLNADDNLFTTAAGLLFAEDKVISFHAGDSRIYRLRGKYLSKITKDHSFAQEMIDAGIFTEDEETMLSMCSTITRCMGDAGFSSPEVREAARGYYDGELYMVCSDGIWTDVSFQRLEELLQGEGSLEEMIEKIVQAALEGGSKDNLSIGLARITAEK